MTIEAFGLDKVINQIAGRGYPYPRFIKRLRKFAALQKYDHFVTPQAKLDVVLLTFNRLQDTKRTLDSLYQETKLKFDLHILDGNSNDGTREYLQQLAKQKSNIDLVLLPGNLGVSGSRAKALEKCDAEFIAYIDNDMVLMPGYLENLLNSLTSQDDIAGVQSKVVYPGGKIQINDPEFEETEEVMNFYDEDSDKNFADPTTLTQHQCKWIPMGATVWRRSVLDAVQIDPQMLGSFEDNDFAYRASKQGYTFLNCPQSLVIHISAVYTPGAMADQTYTAGRFNQEKTRNATKRFYQKYHKIFVNGKDWDDFALTLGFENFQAYHNYILE